MPADAARLSIIVASGSYERVHYALVLASAALAIDRPVTLFFTLDAVRALTLTDGKTGWARLPTADGRAGNEADAALRARGIAGFEDLLAACIELGARMIVCEMALAATGVDPGALRTDAAIEIAGAVTLLAEGDAAPIVL